MIFQKKTRKSQNPQFFFNNSPIDITHQYAYLGLKLTPSGTFTVAQEQLHEKAMHAFFCIKKYTDFSKLPTHLASNIFDAVITPILAYNSEVGVPILSQILITWDKSQIENPNFDFAKDFQECKQKSSYCSL